MSMNNHHNSRCGFEEQLVSYIYGEVGSSEKTTFERHLDGCKSCTNEFAALGIVRSSLAEWREVEFAPLETPLIRFADLDETSSASVGWQQTEKSWFGRVRDYFSFAPAWATATSFAAILAVIAGISILLFNNSISPGISTDNNQDDPKSAEKVQSVNESSQPPTEIKENESIPPDPELAKDDQRKLNDDGKPLNQRVNAVATRRLPKKELKNRPTHQPNESSTASKNTVRNSEKIAGERPRLTDFAADEDDSLRLVDLFDQVGSK